MEAIVANEAAAKRPRGRPKLDAADKRIKKSISLYPKVAAFARELGDGVASTGIEVAVADYRRMSKDQAEKNLAQRPSGLIDHAVEKTTVSLTQEALDLLLVVGDGALSQGIAEVLQTVMGARHWKG